MLAFWNSLKWCFHFQTCCAETSQKYWKSHRTSKPSVSAKGFCWCTTKFVVADHPSFSSAPLKFQNLPKVCPWHPWFICFYLHQHCIFYVISYEEIKSKRKILNSSAVSLFQIIKKWVRRRVRVLCLLHTFYATLIHEKKISKSLKIYITNKTRIFTISEHLFGFLLASSLRTEPPSYHTQF